MERFGGRFHLMVSRVKPSHRWLFALFFLIVSEYLSAQTAGKGVFDAVNLRQPTMLNYTWLVHAGDDPAYALLDYDDSQWTPFNPSKSVGELYGKSRPEIVWYRLRLKVDPHQNGLAIEENNLAPAFEIYANGERIMSCGSVVPYRRYTYAARMVQPFPQQAIASGTILLALRVHVSHAEWNNGQDVGLYFTNLSIGQDTTLRHEDWLTIVGTKLLSWLDHGTLIGLGVIALVLFAAQRRQTEYLWISALAALNLAETFVPNISLFWNIPAIWDVLTIVLRVFTPFLWGSLYLSFVHQRVGWRWRIFFVFAGLGNALSGFEGAYFSVPVSVQFATNLPFVTLLSVIVPIVLLIHWRRGNREAGILLIPTVLFSLYIYGEFGMGFLFQFTPWRDFAIRGLNVIDRFPLGPFEISLNSVSGILSTVSLAIIMLLRSTTMSRRQAQLESELEAAQQVQQLLVPEQSIAVPGFEVDSAYHPAQQVGGDFFQILPTGDGGLLVLVGDVAGKGLPAAMLVSVLVGAIRSASEFTRDPAELLAHLNDRLIGRAGGGFSTALAAHIDKNGGTTVANAGHLYPYLDGREMELPGALPLGIAPGVAYSSTQLYLTAGSRLTFYSDGVVEAQNAQGELFGFERSCAFSTQPAAAIVEAAKQFGQKDDITVVTIERTANLAAVV